MGSAEHPFSELGAYAEDGDVLYVPQMFGRQRDDFLRKFVLAPLETGQPLMGAVWSLTPGGDPKARGFGKSTLMGEEAKRINRDFGASTLRDLGVSEEDVEHTAVMAGYVSFNVRAGAGAGGGIASIDAAAFHLARFILRDTDESVPSMHQRLRTRAINRMVAAGQATEATATEALVEAVRARFRRLAVAVDIRGKLEDYLFLLASPNTDDLNRFLYDDVGVWHHDRNGIKYLQLLLVFAELAGVEHSTLFVDQVEDFTTTSNPSKIMRNVRTIRDTLLESEPFVSLASFVFQLHPDAYEKLRVAWQSEDLRSLDWSNPLNSPYVIVLQGLKEFESARVLAECLLNHPSVIAPGRTVGLHPFTEPALRQIWLATRPQPRSFLRMAAAIMNRARDEQSALIDDVYVSALRGQIALGFTEDDDDDEFRSAVGALSERDDRTD